MHGFLKNNHRLIIERCQIIAKRRNEPVLAMANLSVALPELLSQITELMGQQASELRQPPRYDSESDTSKSYGIGQSAIATGKALHSIGFSIEDVVLGYGDLCQAISELIAERDVTFQVTEFRLLNLCLDIAIAYAVRAFTDERDKIKLVLKNATFHEEASMVAHEMRNLVHTTQLAFEAMQAGDLSARGSTGLLAARSLTKIANLTNELMREVAQAAPLANNEEIFALAPLILEIEEAARLASDVRGISFSVSSVDPLLKMQGNRDLLYEAISNLIQNAFKFTKERSAVALRIYANEEIHIEVHDQCGGFLAQDHRTLFEPFVQIGKDRSGLGLGLTIAKRNIENMRGVIDAKDIPGHGCVFFINMPLIDKS